MKKVCLSLGLAFLVCLLFVSFEIPLFLRGRAQSTFLNKNARLEFEVLNKDSVTFEVSGKRIKTHQSKNKMTLSSEITYVNRHKEIVILLHSDKDQLNTLSVRFSAPNIYFKDLPFPAKIQYKNIKLDGKEIQKNVLTSHEDPFDYVLEGIPNDTPVILDFRAKKPFQIFDFNFLMIGGLFLILFAGIFYWKKMVKRLQEVFTKLNNTPYLKKILTFFLNYSVLKMILMGLVIYGLCFWVAYFTPLHSDDWTQMDDGVSLSKILSIYMTWSGRLIADTIARSLLQLENFHTLMALINSCVPVVVCLLLTFIPSQITKKKPEPLTLLILFVLYWICNSNLGQTTFWIVGSANYLWTNLVVLCFLFFYLRYYQKDSFLFKVILFLFAVSAGCTNEHTALTLIPILLGSGWLLKKQYPHISTRNTWISLTGILIGAGVLFAAPGNYARVAKEGWGEASLVRKTIKGVERVIRHFVSFKFLLIALGLGVFLSKEEARLKKDEPAPFWWSILFIFAAFFAAGVMILSPSASARTFNNSLIFLLLALSFILQTIPLKNFETACFKGILILFSGIIFMYSYVCILYSYHSTFIQQQIRMSTIDYYRNQGAQKITVPEFYFPKLRSVNDKFDLYHNTIGMGHHFGVQEILLNRDVLFDYAALKTGKKISSGIEDVFMIVHDSNAISDGTVIIGSNDKNKNLESCKLFVNDLFPKDFLGSLDVGENRISGVSVYKLNSQKDRIQLKCPF